MSPTSHPGSGTRSRKAGRTARGDCRRRAFPCRLVLATMARVTEYAYQGPKRGADRAVLLAHGAGADMHAATLTTVASALADARIPSLRFNFPYRTAGRKAPDRPAVLEASVREAAAELTRVSKVDRARLVLGGRSMGGRICSIAAADAHDPVPA